MGHVILVIQGSFDTPTVFVALALLCILGVILFKGLELAEERMLPWHASQRGKPAAESTPSTQPDKQLRLLADAKR